MKKRRFLVLTWVLSLLVMTVLCISVAATRHTSDFADGNSKLCVPELHGVGVCHGVVTGYGKGGAVITATA